MRFVIRLLLVAIVVAIGAWFWAGRAEGPRIELRQPDRFIGQAGTLELLVEAPGGQFSTVDVVLEQGGKTIPVFTLDQPGGPVRQDSADRLYVSRPIGKKTMPDLQPGPARIVARAARPVLYGIRQASSELAREVVVRLDPPRVGVLSTIHYVNHGGAEFVVYRAEPADVESGIRVGDVTYPGFPASGVGIKVNDTTRVAFFALLNDQDVNTPVQIYARDAAGNEASTPLDRRAFPKTFQRSRIALDDAFLGKVVPSIAATTPDMQLSTAPQDLLASFLRINRDLRQRNNQTIMDLAAKTAPQMLWSGTFTPLTNASVEARFADNRTYVYQGKEVDRQVHLGFDLAVTQMVPVLSAQAGRVLYAADLGIYGNCVIVDHGLGVQSLYAHLSSIDVKAGDTVTNGQQLGRSGMTGLAAGDHLHFTMLLNGRAVNAVEWWDPKWTEDRVTRKIREAGGGV